jgi:hypothetical protein
VLEDPSELTAWARAAIRAANAVPKRKRKEPHAAKPPARRGGKK